MPPPPIGIVSLPFITATITAVVLLTVAASASVAIASSSSVPSEAGSRRLTSRQLQQRQQQPSLCSNSMVTEACRGFSSRQQPSATANCHDQVLTVVCSVRSLRCPPHQPTAASQPPLENPVCLQSCLRVFRRCSASTDLAFLLSYVSITDDLCTSLPSQLCQDWREHSQRDDRSVGPDTEVEQQNICRPVEASSPCKQAVYIGDVARRRRRGAAAAAGVVATAAAAGPRHPFRKSNFREGNYTYAAIVKLAKAEWRQEQQPQMLGDQPPHQQPQHQQQQVFQGGYEKVLHLEIIRVLHSRDGGLGGHMLDPGSVQIVRLEPGCACAPVKLDQSLIFVGYNSYLENVWKTVTLLPNNSHYACKIRRCWNKRRRSPGGGGGGDGGDPCECPCGKADRRRCKRRRHQAKKRRRGVALLAAGRRAHASAAAAAVADASAMYSVPRAADAWIAG